MKVDFGNIFSHTNSLVNFRLKWRFTDEKYDKLSDQHLELLRPLDKAATQFLSDYIDATDLHRDLPFKKGLFCTIDKAKVLADNQKEIKAWLYERRLH